MRIQELEEEVRVLKLECEKQVSGLLPWRDPERDPLSIQRDSANKYKERVRQMTLDINR